MLHLNRVGIDKALSINQRTALKFQSTNCLFFIRDVSSNCRYQESRHETVIGGTQSLQFANICVYVMQLNVDVVYMKWRLKALTPRIPC